MEKDSAAAAMATALGGRVGVPGKYNGTDYVIVALRGHMYEYRPPDEQVADDLRQRYKSWDTANLPWDETAFQWKRAAQKGVSAKLDTAKRLLGQCQEICFGGDVDPSGEGALIDLEVVEELHLRRGRKFTRMYFDDESPKSLQSGFLGRVLIPDIHKHDECMKAMYRSRWDFLSQQFTRIATACGDGRSVLRQGRLKSAIVLLVGDQLKAVAEYEKIPYYQNRFRDDHGIIYTDPNEPRFPDEAAVPRTYKPSAIAIDKKSMKSTPPPRLLDLAKLSSVLAAKGYKPKEVLATYQKMYEYRTPLRKDNNLPNVGGIVSYPRTEDKAISPEQFNDLLPYIDWICAVAGVDPKLVSYRQPRGTHVKAGGAHGANRPGLNVPNSLDELRQFGPSAVDIYRLLARNYLAMLCPDYEYEKQDGHVADYPAFKGTCNVPKIAGWKAVYSQGDDDADDSAIGLGTMAEPFVYEGFPPKPKAPTMDWLTAQLEKRDVGTGATRTSTIADVTDEKSRYPLMKESRGRLSLTEFGEMSYKLLPGTHIGDLGMTERVYAEMRDVAAGKLDMSLALSRVQAMVKEDLMTMAVNGCGIEKKAGNGMNGEKEYYEGTWNGRKIRFNRNFQGHRFTDEECEDLLAGKEIGIKGLKSKKTGAEYGVTGKLADMTYNGHDFVGFERTGWLHEESVPKSWCGHTFTKKEIQDLEAGMIIEVKGLKSKAGNVFDAEIRYGEKTDGRKGIIPKFDRENF